MNAATGILCLDIMIRPYFKVSTKFPMIGVILLFAIYGGIADISLKIAYLADNN